MSNWTRVILTCSNLEDDGPEDAPRYPAIDHINGWMADHTNCLLFPVSNPDKTLHSPQGIFAANCKSLPWDDFIEIVAKAPWEWDEGVTLFLEQEDDAGFRQIRFGQP